MGEISFTISGWFSPNLSELPDLDETTSRQVFKIALIEPVTVIELGPLLGCSGTHSYSELGIISSIVSYTVMAISLTYFSLNSTQK